MCYKQLSKIMASAAIQITSPVGVFVYGLAQYSVAAVGCEGDVVLHCQLDAAGHYIIR
jgi:hypothetical protein